MLFEYTTIDEDGNEETGEIEAVNKEVALNSLQRRGLYVADIQEKDEGSILQTRLTFLESVSSKEMVVTSRQISTLFNADVSALKVFRMLAAEKDNELLRDVLNDIARELEGGSSIANAMEKHTDVFSDFYVSMVRAGEESGQLDQTFEHLADYTQRNHELLSKAKNAFIYPIFVILVFIGVMVLMLTTVIPNISKIIEQSGQDIPFYTQIVMSTSDLLVNYGLLLLMALAGAAFGIWRYIQTKEGREILDRLKLSTPYIGTLYRKLYLSQLADNMDTMLTAGIPMIKAVQITADVVDNKIYEDILHAAADDIKSGTQVSAALDGYSEIPGIMIQMIKVGEESGELGGVLSTLSEFYRREVSNAVDTLVGLIEPVLILILGLGVGGLLASVLMPIYNMTASIG
jgi:type IV pilus assembly protein PilC